MYKGLDTVPSRSATRLRVVLKTSLEPFEAGPEPGTAETALCRGPSYEQGILGVPSFSSSSVDKETEEMGKSEETPVATGNVC